MPIAPPAAGDFPDPPDSPLEPGSVSLWLQAYKEDGDSSAFTNLWHRYITQLVEVARTKLGGMPRQVGDEEDIAQAVFTSLHDAVQKRQYPELNDRGDLWQILLSLAERKTIDWKRYLGRDRRDFRRAAGESAINGVPSSDSPSGAGMSNVTCPEPTPEIVAELRDLINHLVSKLPADQRQIARQKLLSFTNEEIAAQTDCVPRTVERKLQLIRSAWTKLLESDAGSKE